MNTVCETGPTVYRPYPRRLESLIICRCHYKDSTFSSVILIPWMLVRPDSNSRPLAQQTGTLPTELTGWRLRSESENLNFKKCGRIDQQTGYYSNYNSVFFLVFFFSSPFPYFVSFVKPSAFSSLKKTHRQPCWQQSDQWSYWLAAGLPGF